MTVRLLTRLILLAGILIGAGQMRADVVETRDGRHLEGTAAFVQGAVIVTADKTATKLKLDEITSLQRETAPAVAAAGSQWTGLMVEYYADPDCKQLCALEPASDTDFDWSAGPPNAQTPSRFTARITGWLIPRTTGEYTLGIDSFSRAQVGETHLGGEKDSVARNVKLEAGQRYPILLQVTRTDESEKGHLRCRLWWSLGQGPREVIPAAALRCPDDFPARYEHFLQEHLAAMPGGVKGEYFADEAMHDSRLVRVDPTIQFIWGRPSQISPKFKENVAVRWTGKLKVPHDLKATFMVTGHPAQLWLDGKSIVHVTTKAKGDKETTSNRATVQLKKDQLYDLKMEYTAQGGGYRDVRVQWNERFAWFHAIPSSMLIPPPDVPRVAIVVPLDKSRVDATAGLPVNVVATPGNGTIKKVEILSLDPDDTLAELTAAPYHALLHLKAAEELTLQARVTNSQGAISLSAPVHVTVIQAPSEVLGKGWSVARIGTKAAAPKVERSGPSLRITGTEGSMGDQTHMPMVSHVLHGNGELIVHLAELKTASPDVFPLAGVTVRGEMSTQAPHLTLVAGRSSGWFVRHAERSIDSLYVEKPLHLPVWLRLVRSGPDVRAYWSEDKHQWTLAGSMTFDAGQDLLIGLTAFALNAKEPATADFDHLSLTTGGQAGLASGAGVQLTNGSIVYGVADVQEATIAVSGADGKIYRFGRDQVARLFYAPVGTDMAAALTPGWRGAIVRNDLVEGEVSEVTSDGAKVSSVLFGIQEVKRDNGLRAVILQDVNPPRSAIAIGYPGGRVLATNVSLDDNKLVIHDAPGGELRLSITELLSLHRSP